MATYLYFLENSILHIFCLSCVFPCICMLIQYKICLEMLTATFEYPNFHINIAHVCKLAEVTNEHHNFRTDRDILRTIFLPAFSYFRATLTYLSRSVLIVFQAFITPLSWSRPSFRTFKIKFPFRLSPSVWGHIDDQPATFMLTRYCITSTLRK